MRAVVQRCRWARVTVGDRVAGEIGPGLVVLLAVGLRDREEDAAYLSGKTADLRVFDDAHGRMNLSIREAAGGGAVVERPGPARGGEAVVAGVADSDAASEGTEDAERGPEARGEVLVISQFTLYGDCRRGRRPSYSEAAGPALAARLYQEYVEGLRARGLRVVTGEFRALMVVELANDGPVTLLLDSEKLF